MDNLDSIQVVWLGGAFTLLGAIIGAAATMAGAGFAVRRQHFNDAAAEFRSAFVEELYRLRQGKEDAFLIINDEALIRQEKAKIQFEPWIGRHKRKAFNQAWIVYATRPKTSSPGSLDQRQQELQETISEIDQLLFYSHPK